jgi:hypothetical protein
MDYTVAIDGFEGRDVQVSFSYWTGSKLLIDGEPAQKGGKRGEMILRRRDGQQVTATWKPQALGLDVPQLVVGGKVINVVEPLKWYQWVWAGGPLLLIALGGALGALAGMLGFMINARVFRSEMSEALKYFVSGAVSVVAVVAYFVLALVVTLLLSGQ